MEQKQEQKHSRWGGSIAKRVIACPGSVALCTQVPDKPSSRYADEGTLLHQAVAICVDENMHPTDLVGKVSNADLVLTEELVEDKLRPALNLLDDYLDEVDPDNTCEYATEQEVSFGKFLPEAYGTCDMLIRAGSRAVVLDWKFGSGVVVDAEENAQLMYYAAAARRTDNTKWVFDGATEVELVIIQPPYIKRWVTTLDRLDEFERELKAAVKQSKQADAPLQQGDHCRWCAGKPICPLMNGAADRAVQIQLREVDITKMGKALHQADLLEQWIGDLRALAHQALEAGVEVPGWKLVDKRATRKWKDEADVEQTLWKAGFTDTQALFETKIKSPAQVEKVLKTKKLALPDELVEKVSSGTTIAPEHDPRPAALLIGQQLSKALGKLI